MSAPVEVPERVRRKALALGPPGERWLRDIPQIVADLERSWSVNVGPAIPGGTGAFVAVARTADGTDAILKVSIPDGLEGHSPFGEELHALQLGSGHGYVRVLRADADRRAMLQEHLGRPLGDLDLPVESQIDIIVSTLRDGVAARSARSRSPNRSHASAFAAGVDPRRLGASWPAVRRAHARSARNSARWRGSPRSTRRPRC